MAIGTAMSMAAPHARGKSAVDKIFGANAAAVKAAAVVGKEKVTNATIGAILDEEEKLVCLPTVEKVFRGLPTNEIVAYAPIAGLPEYLESVLDAAFGKSRPAGYIDAVATSGGSGVLHHVIWNYASEGDVVLTSDWFWGPYRVLCNEMHRTLENFTLFDENMRFNVPALEAKVRETLAKQDSVIVIINSPAHNPTGYSLSDKEWDCVLHMLTTVNKETGKKIVLLVDVAYLDYAGQKDETRSFMSKFGGLPESILTVVAYSMSKGFTMYGQRTGAMIGISSSAEVIKEFAEINQYSSRATWSNISRATMKTLATVYRDPSLLAAVEKERDQYYQLIRARADIFEREAAEVGLKMLPYIAGFFLTIPTTNPDAVCDKLHEVNIFAVPLAKGIRIAVCAVSKAKMHGMAAKFKAAMEATGSKAE